MDNSPDKESPDRPTQLRALADDTVASTYAYGRDLRAAADEIEALREQDRKAATHIESPICMRTHFTGEPPYVGWEGLGLAMREKWDRDEAEIARLRDAMKKARHHAGSSTSVWKILNDALVKELP